MGIAPISLDFLIIGAQRSASTRLNGLIRQHPDVYSPRGEVVYFEDPYFGSDMQASLDNVFRSARADQVLGFKRPALLTQPECPRRIVAEAPSVRLIATLREPVSRTISSYYHYARCGFLPLLPIDQALSGVLDGSLTEKYPWAADVIDSSLYGANLSRFLEVVDRSQIMVVLDEELREDPWGVMAAAFGHIGVDPTFVPEHIHRRMNEGVYAPSRLRLLRIGGKCLYRREGGYVVPRANLVTRSANRLVWVLDRIALAPLVGAGVPALSDDVAQELRRTLLPDLELLERILGRRLDKWRTALDRHRES